MTQSSCSRSTYGKRLQLQQEALGQVTGRPFSLGPMILVQQEVGGVFLPEVKWLPKTGSRD